MAFHRWQGGGPGDDVVVLLNFSAQGYPSYRVGLPHAGLWKVRLNSDWPCYDSDFGNAPSFDTWADPEPRDGLAFSAGVGLGPYSAVILSQDR